jgi:hypothetical protein
MASRSDMLMLGDNILNSGGSFGLQYPLIYGRIDDQYVIWCRHCGIVFDTLFINDANCEFMAKCCRQLNGLSDKADPEVLAAIDATP